MSGSLIDKYAGPRRPVTAEAADGRIAEGESAEDFGSFGWLRGIRDRAPSLELRRKDGGIVAIPYHWIERVELDPSGTIVLKAQGERITLKGRNLNSESRPNLRLFEGITRHRVPWVRELDQAAAMQVDDKATVIESIRIE